VKPIRILLVEDHETVRQGLKLLVDSQEDMEVVGEAPDGRVGLQRVYALRPDVVVMDISMPEMNGLEATHAIRELVPETRVVTLTRYSDPAYVKELLDAGAAAYVLKQSASTELLTAIRRAADGHKYIDSTVQSMRESSLIDRHGREPKKAVQISDREAEVLRMTALGHSNKEIAKTLDLSVKTVEVHKANAMRKLGLRGRIDVVRYALLQGWLQDA
jgi:two-component system, NarL family, response regulator NreC